MILRPNCKINIGLSITGKRKDGYHEIKSMFYPLSGLYDEIELERSDKDGISFMSDGIVIDCSAERNLIVRAYELLRANYGKDKIGGVQVVLHKHIPYGAGLGGGSADAAFMIVGLDLLFGLGMRIFDKLRLATELGADCAFFIFNVPCQVSGIGDHLCPEPLDLSGYDLVLVKPEVSINTKEAYRKLDESKHIVVNQRYANEISVELWKDKITNDFEDVVFAEHSEIKAIKQALYEFGAVYASMSGSGACVYGLFKRGSVPSREMLDKSFEGCFIHVEHIWRSY